MLGRTGQGGARLHASRRQLQKVRSEPHVIQQYIVWSSGTKGSCAPHLTRVLHPSSRFGMYLDVIWLKINELRHSNTPVLWALIIHDSLSHAELASIYRVLNISPQPGVAVPSSHSHPSSLLKKKRKRGKGGGRGRGRGREEERKPTHRAKQSCTRARPSELLVMLGGLGLFVFLVQILVRSVIY